jgi:hypothetical protein
MVLREEKTSMSEEDVQWNIPIGLKLQVPTLYNIGTGESLAWKVKKLVMSGTLRCLKYNSTIWNVFRNNINTEIILEHRYDL